jgi:hypothetical protein
MTDKPIHTEECIENYVKHAPVTIIPYRKDRVLSVLYALGGIIKMRVDYKDQGYNLIQELIRLVDEHNKDDEVSSESRCSWSSLAPSVGINPTVGDIIKMLHAFHPDSPVVLYDWNWDDVSPLIEVVDGDKEETCNGCRGSVVIRRRL